MEVMSEETQVVRPLTSDEIKDAIAQTIAEKVRESLNTTCWLYGMSWPKFKATWRVDVTLENFGQEQKTSVTGTTHEMIITDDHPEPKPVLRTDPIRNGKEMAIEGEIPYTPPNVLRKQHGMAIPTVVKRDDGSTEQKAVFFKQKRGRAASRDDA
jgi:hypothetical protein